jgi:hypothetical protein
MPNYFDELYNINSNYNRQLVFHLNAGSDGTYEYINNNKYKFTNSKNNIEIIIHTLNAL